jgi:acyl carrier protein
VDEMTISSRTPEGQPTSCPLCLANVIVEPSVFIGDATCPRCGQLLWFIQTADTARLFDAEQSQERKDRILEIIANQLGVDRDKIANNPALFDAIGADSLDVVELVMELEEEFDLP